MEKSISLDARAAVRKRITPIDPMVRQLACPLSSLPSEKFQVTRRLRTGISGDISDNPVDRHNFEQALRKISSPALVMLGSNDLFFTPEDLYSLIDFDQQFL